MSLPYITDKHGKEPFVVWRVWPLPWEKVTLHRICLDRAGHKLHRKKTKTPKNKGTKISTWPLTRCHTSPNNQAGKVEFLPLIWKVCRCGETWGKWCWEVLTSRTTGSLSQGQINKGAPFIAPRNINYLAQHDVNVWRVNLKKNNKKKTTHTSLLAILRRFHMLWGRDPADGATNFPPEWRWQQQSRLKHVYSEKCPQSWQTKQSKHLIQWLPVAGSAAGGNAVPWQADDDTLPHSLSSCHISAESKYGPQPVGKGKRQGRTIHITMDLIIASSSSM